MFRNSAPPRLTATLVLQPESEDELRIEVEPGGVHAAVLNSSHEVLRALLKASDAGVNDTTSGQR